MVLVAAVSIAWVSLSLFRFDACAGRCNSALGAAGWNLVILSNIAVLIVVPVIALLTAGKARRAWPLPVLGFTTQVVTLMVGQALIATGASAA
jgi:hypothetical protein